jgi:hypothetical protein
MQKMNAVLDMTDDYEKAIQEFHKEDTKIKNGLK